MSAETIVFGELSIDFDERVLRPRVWTLEQSRWAARLLPTLPEGPVLELCSGAGQIGIAAVQGSGRSLVCVDANPAAVSFTRANAARAGMAERIEVREGRLEQVLGEEECFALVVADPPWVPREQIDRFPEDPRLAIDGGDDGLGVVRLCVEVILAHLAPGGAALLQLGTPAQAEAVASLVATSRLRPTELREYADRGVILRLDDTGAPSGSWTRHGLAGR